MLLVPYFSRMSCSFGRLSPIVPTWKSPLAISVSIALPTGGLTSSFLNRSSHGALCSK